MQSQLKIRIKKTEYICFNAVHHFLIHPFFCFPLSPCTWGFKFFLYSYFGFFFFLLLCCFFFFYLAPFLEEFSIPLILLQQFITLQAICFLIWLLSWLSVEFPFSFCSQILSFLLASLSILLHFPISLTCFYSCGILLAWDLANTLRVQ